MKFTQKHADTIRAYGAEAGYVEVGGVITTDGGLIYLGNEHPYPNYFEKDSSGNDIIYPCVMDYMSMPNRALIWHTHPPQWWCSKLSQGDIEVAQYANTPILSYHHASENFDWYCPPGTDNNIDFSVLQGKGSKQSAFQLTELHQQKILQFVDHCGYSGEEIAGVITSGGDVRMLPNTASDRTNHFQIDWGSALVAAVWHTHLPHHPAKLSESDIAESDCLGQPYVMYHIGQKVWDIYCPNTATLSSAISSFRYQQQIKSANERIIRSNKRYIEEIHLANSEIQKERQRANRELDVSILTATNSEFRINAIASKFQFLGEIMSSLLPTNNIITDTLQLPTGIYECQSEAELQQLKEEAKQRLLVAGYTEKAVAELIKKLGGDVRIIKANLKLYEERAKAKGDLAQAVGKTMQKAGKQASRYKQGEAKSIEAANKTQKQIDQIGQKLSNAMNSAPERQRLGGW